MFDEMDRLREAPELQELLTHYRDLGVLDRTVWQDRLSAKQGSEPRELVRLHGELIGHGWIEQNTGVVVGAGGNAARACYRITLAGIRALKQLAAEAKLQPDGTITESAVPEGQDWCLSPADVLPFGRALAPRRRLKRERL